MLTGPLSGGGKYSLRISDTDASLKLPSLDINWIAGKVLGVSLLPEHSGGLMPALFLWRRLAVEGLGRFGKVYYYGTAPLVGHEGLADVLVGTYNGVECRFYFEPADGRLLALEMFPDDESDPCEVFFSDYFEKDGRFLPGKMVVRYGDEPFATLKIDGFKADEKGED